MLVRDALHAQVRLVVHELRERRVAYLGAAEVDDLHVALGVLVREADPEQDAQCSAKRVACHEELGVRNPLLVLEVEHLFHLRVFRENGEVG